MKLKSLWIIVTLFPQSKKDSGHILTINLKKQIAVISVVIRHSTEARFKMILFVFRALRHITLHYIHQLFTVNSLSSH